MPGLTKARILERIQNVLIDSNAQLLNATFIGKSADLPCRCTVVFRGGSRRHYDLYFWTIAHGGRSRRRDEYRIQIKLKIDRRLRVDAGTTVLLGYYHETLDRSGRARGNTPPDGMEVFVAWDALYHLRLGASSSCQVPFSVMYDAYLNGKACVRRSLASGDDELVYGLRPEYLSSYLRAASGGHAAVVLHELSPAYLTRAPFGN
ncbi:MAG TPA: hypothetical protein VMW58_05415 [Anaerolineae bacterium]|nr:hypothetical protein [Anaerolineae bacterium]